MRSLTRCLIVLAFTATVAAQLPETWQHWRFFAPVTLGSIAHGGLAAVPVPVSVSAQARRGWIDLRLIDATGAEVPFVLHARQRDASFERRQVPLLEPTSVEGQYQQAIADAGEQATTHNAMRLGIQTDQNLLGFVEIAVSSDLKEWRVVRDRAPIFVLTAEGRGQNTDVSYPESASRYVRIRILEGSGKYALRSAELGHQVAAMAEYAPAQVALTPFMGTSGRTVWTSDGDASAVPLSRVSFETTQTSFARSVTVENSDDGERWVTVTTGRISGADAAGGRASLAIGFPETYGRRWRIAVDHHSDAPVADLNPVLLTVPRRVVWRPEAGASYRLLFGHPRAEAARYDLSERVDAKVGKAIDEAEQGTLGTVEENTAWVDPTPWTERNYAVLWVGLVLAVLILGTAAAGTLRSSMIEARDQGPPT